MADTTFSRGTKTGLIIVAVVIIVGVLVLVLVLTLAGDSGNVAMVVANETGTPLPGAAVIYDGIEGGFTDDEGVWRQALSPGNHKVRVSAQTGNEDPPNYVTALATLDVQESNKAQTFEVVMEGWSALAPLTTISDAINGLVAGPMTATITYSFVGGGMEVEPGRMTSQGVVPAYHTVDLTATSSYAFGNSATGLTALQFRAETEGALGQLKALLEGVFRPPLTQHPLTVNFERRTEDFTGYSGSVPVASKFGLHSHYTLAEADAHSIGTIRVAAAPIPWSTTVLAYAWAPDAAPHAKHSDMLGNTAVDWRRDEDVIGSDDSGGGFSVKAIMLHELLHAIGVGHHALPQSLMYPNASRATSLHDLFEGGSVLSSPYERAGVRGLFLSSTS